MIGFECCQVYSHWRNYYIDLSTKEVSEGATDEDISAFRCRGYWTSGMTQEEQHRIFDRFSQANHKTSRDYGGSGLGLSKFL